MASGVVAVRDVNYTPLYIAAIERGINEGLEELEDKTLDQIDKGFEHGRDAMGRPWEPLSDYTIARKGSREKLIETGDMREAFAGDLDTRDNELEIYNDDWKAPIHEFGQQDQNIPRRAMLYPASEWVESRGFNRTVRPMLLKSVMSVSVMRGGRL